MHLPEELQEAIDATVETLGLHRLIEARQELTERYRAGYGDSSCITTDVQRKAYLIARLPATYSAVCSVMGAIVEAMPSLSIASLLDLGAGPGTIMWAMHRYFPDMSQVTLHEKDISLLSLGKQLASFHSNECIRKAMWQVVDLEQPITLDSHEAIVLSYSLGELNPLNDRVFLEKCWHAASKMLVIIEPGTPVGFERIRAARQMIIEMGGNMIAPCPHTEKCPMAGDDWCHFGARVERSSLHRQIKQGSLNYEDEKFSYVAFSKQPHLPTGNRVLARPDRHGGHVNLKLCTLNGIEFKTFSKKMGETYKKAKKIDWGGNIS